VTVSVKLKVKVYVPENDASVRIDTVQLSVSLYNVHLRVVQITLNQQNEVKVKCRLQFHNYGLPVSTLVPTLKLMRQFLTVMRLQCPRIEK
jgi:hypothetical protein